MNIQRKKLVAVLLIGLLFGFITGYIIGFSVCTKTAAEIASYFIDVDYDEVYKALTQYRNNIGGCYNG